MTRTKQNGYEKYFVHETKSAHTIIRMRFIFACYFLHFTKLSKLVCPSVYNAEQDLIRFNAINQS